MFTFVPEPAREHARFCHHPSIIPVLSYHLGCPFLPPPSPFLAGCATVVNDDVTAQAWFCSRNRMFKGDSEVTYMRRCHSYLSTLFFLTCIVFKNQDVLLDSFRVVVGLIVDYSVLPQQKAFFPLAFRSFRGGWLVGWLFFGEGVLVAYVYSLQPSNFQASSLRT
ncbi:hypothetical protein CC2G_015292 [Coprinopsis cinerea AmutBmut pab1-1]|nr:hypothetical protein CC2G_015292 [Coprinopsis cinerea AmutBmut pab1-1]